MSDDPGHRRGRVCGRPVRQLHVPADELLGPRLAELGPVAQQQRVQPVPRGDRYEDELQREPAPGHLVLQVQRTADGHLLFQSITLNGQTAALNYYESPTSTSWRGITINYQMDGNRWQTPYTVYLDQLNFTYW